METVNDTAHAVTYLKDYTPPHFLIEDITLTIDLHDAVTYVRAKLQVARNKAAKQSNAPLVLNGEHLVLKEVKCDGEVLSAERYQVSRDHLTINTVPDQFVLETAVEIDPAANKALSGLYMSRGNYCTQCESHGFRRITYFPDRPDVMAYFKTTITADKARYPVLLSNGNLVDSRSLPDGRHSVTWSDPSRKPCYLFALVAGDYDKLEDTFTTCTGRTIALHLYLEKGKASQGQFALEALQRAMHWDEENYGREYDLDIYMIVAVSDFNFGAMENKGLNIFNAKYILANPETASDGDYGHVEAVIGHEYFHNWTGNRITCRDWFQISLKEGLTVFREQGFSADMTSPVVQRIQDVRLILSAQFAEDAGPMAHPVRPDSYIEVNNFYTLTVYEKGAEVIRMIKTLIGPELFRKGMDNYFERHDGQAVTTDDFVQAMQDASGTDLTQFKRWYSQAGTPVVKVTGHYEPNERQYTLTVEQSCPPTPNQPEKQPLHFPLTVGLLDEAGNDLPLQLSTDKTSLAEAGSRVLTVNKKKQVYTFVNIECAPTPSLLRNFSAPVRLQFDYSESALCFLLAHDSDGFNRWLAGQKLAEQLMLAAIKAKQKGGSFEVSAAFTEAFKEALNSNNLDKLFIAELLALPSENYLIQQVEQADPEIIYAVRESFKVALASCLKPDFLKHYQQNVSYEPYRYDNKAVGQRALKNSCLAYLMKLNEPEHRALSVDQFNKTDNMTDRVGALVALMDIDCDERTQLFDQFYKKWHDEDLVINKWLSLQAISRLGTTFETVKALMKHPCFDNKNPNKVHALIGGFCSGNPACFHAAGEQAYAFLADTLLEIDTFNAQLAARLVEPFTRWKQFDVKRQQLMRAQLERLLDNKRLSKNVFEVVSKSLSE